VQTSGLTIGAFASAAGVNVETIRFYQRRGLVREPPRTFGRIRHYEESDISRVRFIKGAQQLGFTLDEIAGLLRLEDGTHCGDARVVATEKLSAVRGKLAELGRMESALSGLVAACEASSGLVRCPLIGALRGPSLEGT
jgi:MerR family mercuric resistance operon transcriptional regulator